MLHLRSIVTGAAALVSSAALTLGQPLPTDPSLVTGQLDNGLKYIVRKHDKPAGRAAVWIHFDTGSLNETDRQRGLAHYLEHLAFNGSENFPPGSVVPFFQSLGMTFGRDQNAFTSMEQTAYQLALPDAKPETLGKGMTFFADVLYRLALLPAEIDAERQIIQEERRRSLSGRQRTMYHVMERIAPGSLYGQRITIGTEETINSVNQADFKDYYGKYYTASNATVLVVADADPNAVIGVIKDKFAGAPKKAKPTAQAMNIKPYEKSFAIVASDPEVRSESLRISTLEPASPPVTTVPQYRSELVLRLGEQALNRRLDAKVARGGTSYLDARVSSGNNSGVLYSAEMSGRAAPGKWKEALKEMALELQRARAFGFSQNELDDVRKQLISGAERSVETEGTIQASAIIGRLNGALASGDTIMSPAQRLDLLKKTLPTITTEEVAKRFAEEFDPKAVAFIATLPSGADVPTEAKLLELGLAALNVKPSQETEATHATTLMTELPKAGKVAEMTEHAASKVWSGWLSNNVRVHYRFMDERKNEASVNISLIGGELLETAENRGITSAARIAWSDRSTKKLTSTDVREIMTGKKVNVGGGGFGGGGRGGGRRGGGGGGGGGGDSISLSISGSPAEFETGFQLAYLLLTEPKIEAPAFDRYLTTTKQFLEESLNTPQGVFARTLAAAPYPDNEPRTTPVTAEQVSKLTLAASQAWLEKLIKESPIEVTIVGDIQKDQALDLAARYLGALPARERVSADTYKSKRALQRPKGPRIFEKTVATQTPQAQVFSGFYGADESNVADSRALSMAARCISTRMVKEIREEAQLVYSIGAGSRSATTYPGFGMFSASAPTEPGKTAALVTKIASMFEEFAKNGPSEEEMAVAKKQMANTFEEDMKSPGFWAGRIGEMTFRGANLDDLVSMPAAYQALTAKQIQETFAKYYSKDNAIVVVVKPESSGPGTKGPAAGG